MNLQLATMENKELTEISGAYTATGLLMGVPKFVTTLLPRFPHLRDASLVNCESEKVDLLLGCHFPEAKLIVE